MRVSVKQKYFILFLTGRNLAIYVIPDNQTITEEIEISITINDTLLAYRDKNRKIRLLRQ